MTRNHVGKLTRQEKQQDQRLLCGNDHSVLTGKRRPLGWGRVKEQEDRTVMQGCPQSHTAEKGSTWVGTQVYLTTEPEPSPVPLRGHPSQGTTHKHHPALSVRQGVEAPLGLCFPTGESVRTTCSLGPNFLPWNSCLPFKPKLRSYVLPAVLPESLL